MKRPSRNTTIWITALLAPFLLLLPMQLLAKIGLLDFVSGQFHLILMALIFPSYGLLVFQHTSWQRKVLSWVLFTPIAIIYFWALFFLSMFTACYVFGLFGFGECM